MDFIKPLFLLFGTVSVFLAWNLKKKKRDRMRNQLNAYEYLLVCMSVCVCVKIESY